MNTNDNNVVAVRYLGRALISLILGMVVCFLATLGYNTYIKYSDKKIEVHAENSNSTYLNTFDRSCSKKHKIKVYYLAFKLPVNFL